MGKRLFLAIPIPQSITEELKKVISLVTEKQTPQQKKLFDWRFSSLHLTLVFLGDTSEETEKEIFKNLEKIHFPKFRLEISSFSKSVDPSTNRTRSLRISFDSEWIQKLRESLADIGISMESDFEKHPVRSSPGHITLTYTKNVDENLIEDLIFHLNDQKKNINDWLIEDFILYESVKGTYQTRKKINLE